MKKQSSLAVVIMLSLLLAQTFGQNPTQQEQPQPTENDDDVVRITTNLIQVDAVVTDKNGKQVTDLRADEFEIEENGDEQKITNFSYIPIAPIAAQPSAAAAPADKNAPPTLVTSLRPEQVRRTIALVVDDLGLSFESTNFVRQSLKKFVDEQMQPGDLVAIIRTAGGMGALQQFTSDKRQLYAAIERVRWNQLGRGGVGAFAPFEGTDIATEMGGDLPGRSGDGGNSGDDLNQFREELFSVGTLGALSYIVRGLRDLPGRKSVMLVSDGLKIFDRAGQSDRILDALRRLTDLANRAAVVIYTMDARGIPTLSLTAQDNVSGRTGYRVNNGIVENQLEQMLYQRRADFFESQNGLNYLAQETGGIAFRNSNDLGDGLKQMLDDQQGYYLIGYRPDDGTFDPKRTRFNKLKIKVKRAGLKVRYRSGFFGITDESLRPAPATTRPQQLARALTSPFASGDITLRLTSLFANDPKSGSFMRSLLHVDARQLSFTDDTDGWRKVTFDVMAVTFGDNGQVVDEASRTHNMRVRGETYERIMRDGFDYIITVPTKKAGAYQLRIALRDSATERVGSASQFIEVPDISKNRLTISGIIINGFNPQKQKSSVGNESATAGGGTQSADGANFETDPQAGPAVRLFRRGMVLEFGYVIYNARLDKASQRPQLQTQLRLFRDGRQIFAGSVMPFDAGNQTDLKRLNAGGRLQLGTDMAPGEYVLQVIVTDLLAKDKRRATTQWIDFQIQ